MEIGVAAFALVLAGYSLIANRLDKLSIGPALTFVAVGLVLGPVVLDVLHVDLESSTIRHLSELTLALVLFTDASTVDIAGLRRDAGLIGRLLGIGLLLTIAAGGLVGALVFPELPLATALLIGAILAPTDAALGLPVITNPAVPTRVRRILNVESGLNDGIATPFVLLFIALATADAGSEGHHLADALVEIAIAVVIGIGIGAIGGRLLMEADRRELASGLVTPDRRARPRARRLLSGRGARGQRVHRGVRRRPCLRRGDATCRGASGAVQRGGRDPAVGGRVDGLRGNVRRGAPARQLRPAAGPVRRS